MIPTPDKGCWLPFFYNTKSGTTNPNIAYKVGAVNFLLFYCFYIILLFLHKCTKYLYSELLLSYREHNYTFVFPGEGKKTRYPHLLHGLLISTPFYREV